MFKTFTFSCLLLVGGFIVGAIWSLVMTLAALPGGFLWAYATREDFSVLKPVAVLLSWLPQAYLGVAFVVLVMGLTTAVRSGDPAPWAFVVWPLSFIISNVPSAMALKSATTSTQDEEAAARSAGGLIAWNLTFLTCLIAFIVLAFAPSVARPLWNWVPFGHYLGR